MDFRVQQRDGPARIGQYMYNGETIVAPTILYLHTSRCTAPAFSDIELTDRPGKTKKPSILIGESIFSTQKKKQPTSCLHEYLLYPKDVPAELHRSTQSQNTNAICAVVPARKDLISEVVKNSEATLFIVSNARQLFFHQTGFIDVVTELRRQIGYQKLIYLACVADPTSLAFLTYLGVDVFDSFSAFIAARNETFLFPTGPLKKDQLSELPCSCPSCRKKKDAAAMGYEDILQHNYHMLDQEIKQVRNAIHAGSLRELVEIRVRSTPHLSALLRILDLQQYTYLEERTPIIRKQALLATTKDALARPEVRRFQERVLQRFEKPASARILLLLPCSAKKPYSFSKSHRLFRECVLSSPNPFVVHEVIITSPLGLVPRELELTYPASRYDIAVTGHWDEDEKKMIRTILQKYLQKNTYESILIHLPPAMQAFVNDLIPHPQVTCMDVPTSSESLTMLSKILHQEVQQFPRIKPQQRFYENVRSLASYQFGPILANILMKDCIITGKYPYQKIMDHKTQLGMMTEERGFISLTMAGAQRFSDTDQYEVEIYDDFPLKGSVFAPGIKQADPLIRIGDEVLVKKNKMVCGVGVALMNGAEMTQATQGEAVKIRHHL